MIYLFLAIVCSSLIAIIFKYSESNDMNRYVVTTANYFMAFCVSLALSIKEGLFSIQSPLTISSFFKELKQITLANQGSLSINSSFIWAIGVGVIAGIFFFLSFIYYQKSVRENGVGLAGTFSKLGILVPMSLSIILWREIPTITQWTGIILSIASIILVNVSFKGSFVHNVKISLILLFVFGGLAEFSNKIFQKYAVIDYKSLFLFFVFFTAFIISLVFTIREKSGVTIREIITGFMVGIPNLFSSFFLIMALDYIKTSVAFPIYSAGTIAVISLSGVVFFKERLSTREIVSIFLTITALILI